uniref:Small ribosomal subunit protein uS15 n=2 Tax=Heterorhabditis bacteriophora TaxID=37862 RepID=A0A1I7XJ66_HETBA
MGRIHNPGKGMSKSALPYRRSVPSWLKLTSEDVQEHIVRLAKKGLRPSQIGVILRDSHGVAQVRRVTGNKIFRILKAKASFLYQLLQGMAPEIPEDLYHLIKKAVSIRKHLERCRKDIDSKYRLILVESRIHRLARYYKTKRQLPATWKNVIAMAWDKEGDVLGILTDGSSMAVLWDINTRNAEQLETSMVSRIRVREMRDLNEIFIIIDADTEKELSQIECSQDGQLVAVTPRGGGVTVYLTKMPVMGAAYQDSVAVLSSLNQVTFLPEGDKQRQIVVDILVEPSLIAVGPFHIAVATNNRIWFYDIYNNGTTSGDQQPIADAEYLSTVTEVQLNDEYAAVTMDGKVRLHKIIDTNSHPSVTFPEPSRNARLLSAALTNHFLVFSTDTNYLVYFSLEERCVVSEYRHTSALRQVYPDSDALRACVFDDRADTWVYSPVDDSMHKLPPVGSTVHYKAALWETFTIDRDTFIVYDNVNIYVFIISKSQIVGESILFVGSTKLPYAHTPLMLSKGIVHCLTASGKTSGVLLDSHKTDSVLDGKSPEAALDSLSNKIMPQSTPVEAQRPGLEYNDVDILDWYSCSPDLNPMKNLGLILVHRIHADNCQFEILKEPLKCH